MSSLNVGRATDTMTSAGFLKTAVLVVVGMIASSIATDYIRSNVYDVSVQGGDAVYAAVTAFVVLAVAPAKYGKPVALGCTASAVSTVARDFNLI